MGKGGKTRASSSRRKAGIVLDYASTFGVGTFIETGTYRGDMVYAMKNQFHAIISIELSADLMEPGEGSLLRLATHRHSTGRWWHNCTTSQQHFEHMLVLAGRALFSRRHRKGHRQNSVAKEIATILRHKIRDHVILIDDARCFDGTHDYPALNDLQEFVALSRPDYAFSVANDVIRIHPQEQVHSDF